MCYGDGVSHPRSELVDCANYSSMSGMGYYAMLLLALYIYVCLSSLCLIQDFVLHSKGYKQIHDLLDQDSSLIEKRHTSFIDGIVEDYLTYKKSIDC